ncbi:LysR family transcriptional regulator [Marinomonas epiphytica]
MDIKRLKSFVAVARHQNFSSAAQELHTVQPAISRHVSALEEELGVPLFQRNSRHVEITRAGQQLLVDAERIIHLSQTAKSNALEAHKGTIGELRIGYLSSACLTFMPLLVQKFRQKCPNVRIHLIEMTVSEQLEAFERKQIDVGFSRPMPETLAMEFSYENIYEDKLVAVLNEHHAMANQPSLSITDLKNESFILFNREQAVGLFDEIIHLCKQADFSPRISSQPLLMQTLLTEVAAGLGIAIAPYCIRKQFSEGCSFVSIRETQKPIFTQLHYQHRANDPIVATFVDVCLAAKSTIAGQMQKA